VSRTARAWLVERTYSDDDQNVVILTYATPDGGRYLRKERALTSFDDERETPAAVDVPPDRLAAVDDPETEARYRAEAGRLADRYDPDERSEPAAGGRDAPVLLTSGPSNRAP